MSLRTVAVIARHELRIVLRNRWIALYAAVFAGLTFAVSYFGLVLIEFTGFQEFHRTAVSLLNLVLYLVPLAAMLMAAQSFRPEGGATEQLFAEPVTAGEIVLGKFAGLSAAHTLAIVGGFSFTGVLIALKVGTRGLSSYLLLIGFASLVGMAFLAIASMLAIATRRSGRTYAAVLVVWFLSVLIFDLLIIGLSFVLPHVWANRVALAGAFLNPVDATRVATLLAVAGKEVFGSAGAQLVRALGGASPAVVLLAAALAGWVVWPVAAAVRLLGRQDV